MSLRPQLMSGVFFTAISKYANVVISLIVTAVLSRVLLPEEFGVVAIATVVISFLSIFADIGLTSTIIQFKELQKKQLNILFSLSMYLGIFLGCLVFFGGYFIAIYYNEPSLVLICKLLSFNLLFTTLSVVPNAIFYREKLFKEIAVRSFLAQLASGSVAIAWALYYRNVYALVIGPILSSILIFVISYQRFPLKVYLRFSVESISHTFKYSLYQFLFNTINFFSRNMDTLVIGKVLGPSILGYYDKAYRLMSLPLQNITQVVTPVLHPLLSGHSDDVSYLKRINESMAKILALLGFPMSVWLYFSAHELIVLFFGAQWYVAVPAFQFLSLTVGIQLILSSSGSFFQTGGDTRSLFICGVFSAILNVGAILIGVIYFESIEAVALGLLFTFTINFVQAYWLLYKKVFNSNCISFFQLLLKPLFFSLLLVGVYKLYLFYVDIHEEIYSLFLKSLIYFVFMLIIVFFGGYKDQIVQFVKRKQLPTE